MAQIGGQVNIDTNELSISKKNGYDVIQWNASMHKIQQVGAPELPVTVQTFVVPLDVKVTGVAITVKNRSTIEQTLTPYPAQPIPPETGEKIGFVKPNPVILNADILVKSGGTLNMKNNGYIYLYRHGKVNAEKGATVNALHGEVQTTH